MLPEESPIECDTITITERGELASNARAMWLRQVIRRRIGLRIHWASQRVGTKAPDRTAEGGGALSRSHNTVQRGNMRTEDGLCS
jgi:hypothetical protein